MTDDTNAPEAPEPPKSVLQELSQRTGASAKLMLEGSDSVQVGASPYVDAKSVDKSLLPKGRGNYQILGEIARGGMGTVLKGHDTDLGRDIAVKVLETELAKRPEVLQRFVEEAQIGGQLQHPGIVPVYELGLMADERPYFTMKLIKGRTLSALLAARRSLDEDRTRFLKIFESVCQTVAYAHSKGVIHRDLKPANVMVGAFGEVQVVDWGLAKVLKRGGVEDEKRAEALSHLTVIETVRSGPGSSGTDSVVGSVMGTPAYMPPEQAMGELGKVDETSDVFSLGAILCEILTGKAPYVDEDRRRVVEMAAQAEIDPARRRIEESGADPELIRLCLACLTPSRMARPRNAEDVAERLHEFLSTTEERAQEMRIKAVEERRRRRLAVSLGATIIVALVAIGGGYLWVEAQQAQRLAETERLFEEQYAKALGQQEAGEYEAALASARDALRVVEAGGAEGALGERARRFVANAEERVADHERRLAVQARNDAQVRTFEDLRLQLADFSKGREEVEAQYAQAFADFGLDMGAEDLSPALDAMLASGIGEQFSFALDDWALLKRRLASQHKEDFWSAERLQLVATDLDPHPLRKRMREAIRANDEAALIELTEPDNLRELPPATVWVLTRVLWGMGERDVVRRTLERAVAQHPGDFILNFVTGWVYSALDREEIGIAYTAVARSLRPDNAYIHGHYGDVLVAQGRWAEALRSYQVAAELDPSWSNMQFGIGTCHLWLGRFEEMVAARERELELELADGEDPDDDPDLIRAEIVAARYGLGQVSAEDVRRWMWDPERRQNRIQLAYALLVHPDPEQRDAAAALQAAQRRVSYEGDHRVSHHLIMLAHDQLGNHAEALRAADRFDELRYPANRSAEASVALVRAAAYLHLGEGELARAWFDRADAALDLLRYAYPEDWERAPIVRRRDEIAALLGL